MNDTPPELRLQAENLLKAINEGTGSARALIVTLLVLAVYIFIVVAGTNDEQLLRNSSVAVPTLSNAVVPANAFYAVMPWAFVFLHLDLLIHLGLLSDKLYRFNQAVEAIPDPVEARDLRLRLAGFPFANWLGSDPRQSWGLYLLQGLTVWLSLVLIPLLLLAYLQLGFLAYHSVGITWGHRLALIADVALLLYFWPRLVKGRYRLPQVKRPLADWLPAIRQRLDWRHPLREWKRLWADWNQRLIAALPARVKTAAFRFARQRDRALALPKALALVLMGLAGLGLRIGLRGLGRLWVVAVTPLAAPLLFLALLVATIPEEPMDRLAREWLGEVVAGKTNHEKPYGVVKAFQDIATNRPVKHDTTWTCVHWLTRLPWVPAPGMTPKSAPQVSPLESYADDGVDLPYGLPATCPTLALFHLHGSPFHRNLRVRDRVIATGELRPELVKKVRSTLKPPAEARSRDPLREFEEAVFEVNGLDLSERDLRFGVFQRSSFPSANLNKAGLDHAHLELADLRLASLSKTKLSAYLHGANLSGASLGEANLSGADLTYANLSGASLGEANLSGADLTYATLSGASLWKANLSGAYLGEATLSGASLGEANLSGANLWKANLSGASLGEANLSGANLWKANLSGAYLTDATLSGASLGEANLSGANLWKANLSGAYLGEATLSGANLSNAWLSGTYLTAAKQDGVVMLEPVWTGPLWEEIIQEALQTWDQVPPPDPALRKVFEKQLRNSRGETTEGLDFSACIGVAPCPIDAPSLQRNVRDRTKILKQLACPTEGKASAKEAESAIEHLSTEADWDTEIDPLPPPPWMSALVAAARQALIELASGPCQAELIEFIPKEYHSQANAPAPASPSQPPSSSP